MTQQQIAVVAQWLKVQAEQVAVHEADQRSGSAVLERARRAWPQAVPGWQTQPRNWRGRWCK
jgi:hypothetical protein